MCQPTELKSDIDYLARQDNGIQQFYFRDMIERDRFVFWESRRHWFAEKGYTLYTFLEGDLNEADPRSSCLGLVPSRQMQIPTENPMPYAYFGGNGSGDMLTGISQVGLYHLCEHILIR